MAAIFLEVKRPEREACRSSPSFAEGKNAGAIPAFPILLHGVVTCRLYLFIFTLPVTTTGRFLFIPRAELSLNMKSYQYMLAVSVADRYEQLLFPREEQSSVGLVGYIKAVRNSSQKTKLHGLSPRANYTDRATAA
jgi:hypothetical protein